MIWSADLLDLRPLHLHLALYQKQLPHKSLEISERSVLKITHTAGYGNGLLCNDDPGIDIDISCKQEPEQHQKK